MKKAFLLCMAAVMLLCSFSLKNLFGKKKTTTETTTQTTSTSTEGQAAGKALKALYTQYKADGTFDYTNLSNIANTMILLQNCKNLKTQAKDSDYWKSFASGLILGSDNLVTESMSNTVTSSLSSLMENVDTDQLDQSGNNPLQTASTVKKTAGSLQTLLGMFQ